MYTHRFTDIETKVEAERVFNILFESIDIPGKLKSQGGTFLSKNLFFYNPKYFKSNSPNSPKGYEHQPMIKELDYDSLTDDILMQRLEVLRKNSIGYDFISEVIFSEQIPGCLMVKIFPDYRNTLSYDKVRNLLRGEDQ
ncbi:hypothetical protein J4214_02370 [Candidatus Woesearchaeota archaeon]|nr:hypothetical protein [Candidatus Woesearchaeota archaeon]